MHILIIEDDSIFAEILQTFIQDNACTCDLANDLASAKQILSTISFDLIMLDNQLPDGQGIHFIETINAMSSVPLPIMMITADDDQAMMLKAFENGADDFLVKPLSLDLLWHKIRRLHSTYTEQAKIKEQTQRLEKLLDKQSQEEKLARYVYEHVSATLQSENECVDTYLQSSSAFNGDVFICDTAPNGNRFVLLADATGHGLSAAISILPLVTTIKAMIRKGHSLHHIVHEANQKLCKELPDDKFVALIGVEVNFHTQTMLLFNGGMPDVISVKDDNTLSRTPSTSLALGIMEPEDYDPGILTISTLGLSNLFFFSDGLIEQQNLKGQEFGMTRVMAILSDWNCTEPLVSRMVNHFSIFAELNELQDDLSICDLQINALMNKHLTSRQSKQPMVNGKIKASIQIEGGLIAVSDIIGMFDGLMKCVDVTGDLRQKSFTVFAELISNALDHGILKLDSNMKNDVSGFDQYVALKEARLSNIEEQSKLEMSFTFIPAKQQMQFSVRDSGKGYDLSKAGGMQDTALSGRGLALINKLCDDVMVELPGNRTKVTLGRE